MRPKILGALPWPLQVIVGNLVYKNSVRSLEGQGTLKFSTGEIASFRSAIWDTLNSHLSAISRPDDQETPFWVLGSDAPTEADATLFGFIASSLICDASVAPFPSIWRIEINPSPQCTRNKVRSKKLPGSR
jgi:hypothetical protein